MAQHYVIGDIQGCFDELQQLLAATGFNHGSDTLWLVGDIVNRGPKSLESLQFCMEHESSVRTVLGNHDLHLLAVMYGCGKTKRGDTLDDILASPLAPQIRDWLRRQPLLLQTDRHVVVHAGILPQWSIDEAARLAGEVEAALRDSPETFFAGMYGNRPDAWHPALEGQDRLRLITNVFTRMRALTDDNRLDYDFKSVPADLPPGLHPWFDQPARKNTGKTIVFGHWSALGYISRNNVIALDTGALWGGELTALNLADHSITQIRSGSRKKINLPPKWARL